MERRKAYRTMGIQKDEKMKKHLKIKVTPDDDYYKQKDIILQVKKIKKLILKSKKANAINSEFAVKTQHIYDIEQ